MTTEEKVAAAMKAIDLLTIEIVLETRAAEARKLADSLDRQAAQIREIAGPLPA